MALVFGGRSGEHEVSVVSARSVAAALDPARFEVVPMAVDRAGRWAAADVSAQVLGGGGARPDAVDPFEGVARLDPRLAAGEIDVVLPILHGPFGEDGTIQGLCEVLDLPYAGCGVSGCAVTMDKVLTKRLLVQAGLPTPSFEAVTAVQWEQDRPDCLARCLALPLPLFVKPARLGSSVGISKVKAADALPGAMALALGYDDTVIVEEGLDAREIEVAVLDGAPPVVSVPGEVVPGREFYDYADKYLEGGSRLIAPVSLGPEQEAVVRSMALAAFRATGCEGMARVDFLLERGSGRPAVNELNAIPGFTSISMYPRLLALSGVPFSELLNRLVALALERHARRARLAAAALRPLGERAGASGPV